jgi:hypothetical protein
MSVAFLFATTNGEQVGKDLFLQDATWGRTGADVGTGFSHLLRQAQSRGAVGVAQLEVRYQFRVVQAARLQVGQRFR